MLTSMAGQALFHDFVLPMEYTYSFSNSSMSISAMDLCLGVYSALNAPLTTDARCCSLHRQPGCKHTTLTNAAEARIAWVSAHSHGKMTRKGYTQRGTPQRCMVKESRCMPCNKKCRLQYSRAVDGVEHLSHLLSIGPSTMADHCLQARPSVGVLV